MKIKDVKRFNRLLQEASRDITKLSTGHDGKNGKGADSIAVGAATPYKQKQTNKGVFDAKFPAVANVVKRLKSDALDGDQIVSGAALAQVKTMLGILPLNKDDNGDIILPFGNNVRLKER